MTIEQLVNKQHLELVIEVRRLATAVGQLHTVFVKRKVLYGCIGALAALVLITGGFAGYFWWSGNQRVNHLVTKLVDNCNTRSKQIAGTDTLITREQDIQAKSAASSARILAQLRLHLTPAQIREQKELAIEAAQALSDWKASQPEPTPCNLK